MKKNKKVTKKILKKRERREKRKALKQKLKAWRTAIIDRDQNICQKCLSDLSSKKQHVHHIISLQSVKRKHNLLLEDINNGILLCGYCHKFAPDSPHQGGFEFVLWLKENKKSQYKYLKKFLHGASDY